MALNWFSAIGPLSFSYAIPLTEAKTDITEKFRFQIGTSFNEKLIYPFLYFICHKCVCENKIVYIDVQYILNNSEIGKYYKKKFSEIEINEKNILKTKQKKIKETQDLINNQKNILAKDELDKKINQLNGLIKEYRKINNDIKKDLEIKRKNYTKEILSQLNPLLTSYAKENNINLIIEKNILLGIKSLDVTENILNIFDKNTKIQKSSDE